MAYKRRIPYFLLAFSVYWLWFGFKIASAAYGRVSMGFADQRPTEADAWDTYAGWNIDYSFGSLVLGPIAVWLIREPEILFGRLKQHRGALLVIGLFTLLGIVTPLSPAASAVLLSLVMIFASGSDATELQTNADPAQHKYSLWFRRASVRIRNMHSKIRIGLLTAFLLLRVVFAMPMIGPPSRYAFITTTFDLSLLVFILSWIGDERDRRRNFGNQGSK